MLWFRYNKPYTREENIEDGQEEETQFMIGHVVGDIAQEFFDDGRTVVIDTSAGFGPENYADYAQQTLDAMADPEVTCIAEATFYTGDIVVFLDLFHRNDDGSWDIYEVKSSKLAKPVHAQDCAWQTYVTRTLCGVNVRNSYIMIPTRGWSIIMEEQAAHTYYCTYELPSNANFTLLDAYEEELGRNNIEDEIALALARRFGSVNHPYSVWYDRLRFDMADEDPLVFLFCDYLSQGYTPEESADEAASTVDRTEHFIAVDDYTDWIYDQSVSEEIPEKVDYLINMVQEEFPPLCTCIRPGAGFECFQPYECCYKGICSEYFDEGR